MLLCVVRYIARTQYILQLCIVFAPGQPTKLHVLATKAGFEIASSDFYLPDYENKILVNIGMDGKLASGNG